MTPLRSHFLARPLSVALVVAGLFALVAALHPVSAAADGCENAAVRVGAAAGLPDCRAYEMVSPVSKNGYFMNFLYSLAGGEMVRAESIGLVAGATSNPDCPLSLYVIARTSGGWVTKAINDAPLSSFTYATSHCTPMLVNSEGASLLQLRPAAGSAFERDLYLHQADGTFALVGPMLPPSAIPSTPTTPAQQAGNGSMNFVAATPDFSHVLFTLQPLSEGLPPGISSELWPGDTTALASSETVQTTSLYEYTGTNNTTPRLVGVDNSGHLISDCGTSPGGRGANGAHLDVMSSDGRRVFFTSVGSGDPADTRCTGVDVVPPVDELFARVEGAHTVAISEPNALASPPPNEGCTTVACKANTSEAANFRDANFERASTDGSKVFFSSPQQLLDEATQDPDPEDGAHPRDGEKGCNKIAGEEGCNLYEYDFDRPEGQRLVLLSGGDSSGIGPNVQGVAAASEDGSHVYFVAKGVLTSEPRGGEGGPCIAELDPAEVTEEETTKEGRCRPKAGADNLYVNDTTTGQTAFVGTLQGADAEQWQYNGEGPNGLGPMETTGDGEFLVFTTAADLTAGDTSTVAQAFRYDAANGALVRVSIGNEGFDDNGNSTAGTTLIERSDSLTLEAVPVNPHPAISEDGSIVVFKSNDALTPQAIDNKCVYEEEGECFEYAQNVYEYREGHVYLISYGQSLPLQMEEGPVTVSPSGRDIFFQARESLVPQDTDTLSDIYDARVDGGFAAPAPLLPCLSGACQGGLTPPPASTSPATTAYSGPGNASPPVAAPKPKPLTRAQKLTKALQACAKKAKKKRAACRAQARKKYGPVPKARKSQSHGRAKS